ncbi:Tetratricopeptide repeat protein 14 like [Schistosoma japonicum]|nr:Tetratricopeptide repeat protein 14 like [Schistosoma japonicum]
MATFGAKLEHLLCSRAEIISRMHRPPPAEGNDLERLLNLPPNTNPAVQAPPPNVPVWPDELAAAFCAVAPPIETFMDVPDEIRRDQFYATCRRDDVLVGVISVIQDSGLVISILAYDQGPRRDFEGLKVTGFCPLRQLPRYNAHGNALDAFQIGDKVRAFILDIHGGGRLILSMNAKMLNRDIYGDLKLGVITDDDMPLYYKKLQNLDGKSYEAYLESTPQFRNPDGLQVLCARMGIPRSSACSLLFCINKIRLPKSEMACELRRTQLLNFSMKHVAQGVKYFKESRNTEALQCYNFAIEVEPTNPDAYVARGALIGRKEISKAEQLLNRALKLDPDNSEARDALKELQTNGSLSVNKDAGLRSWSRTPSPRGSSRNVGNRRDHTPLSPTAPRPSAGYATHMERSRAALEQLVEEDRSRRAAKEANRQNHAPDQSPPGFLSPNRSHERRRGDYFRDDIKSAGGGGAGGNAAVDKSNMDRGDLSKIVITRNRSGRIIRCKDDDEIGDEPNRSEGLWKRSYDDDRNGPDNAKRSRADGESEYRSTRRVFTPPRNAREGEHGSLTVYENENDLPMTSKSLQERVQARLRAIERRHQLEEGNNPPTTDITNGAPTSQDKNRESSLATGDDAVPSESPKGDRGQWRGNGPSSADRRSGGSFQRPEYHGSRGGYYGRNRPRGGPRWRGQWDDYRLRRNNWHNHRYDERRRDGPSARSGSVTNFERRRRRYGTSGSAERSPRSSRSRSRSRSHVSKSRSRSYSRSPRSSSKSQSPVRPGARGRVISRARIKTPPLAPLVTSFRRSESDENLAELDQFVAQLKAKRQLQQQYQQQQYMAQFQEMQGPIVNTAVVTQQTQQDYHQMELESAHNSPSKDDNTAHNDYNNYQHDSPEPPQAQSPPPLDDSMREDNVVENAV